MLLEQDKSFRAKQSFACKMCSVLESYHKNEQTNLDLHQLLDLCHGGWIGRPTIRYLHLTVKFEEFVLQPRAIFVNVLASVFSLIE